MLENNLLCDEDNEYADEWPKSSRNLVILLDHESKLASHSWSVVCMCRCTGTEEEKNRQRRLLAYCRNGRPAWTAILT